MPRDCTYLFFFNTILENVLHHQAARFSQRDLMPHAAKSFVDLKHDLWWLATPAQLEEFLPDVASVSMNDSVRDAAK